MACLRDVEEQSGVLRRSALDRTFLQYVMLPSSVGRSVLGHLRISFRSQGAVRRSPVPKPLQTTADALPRRILHQCVRAAVTCGQHACDAAGWLQSMVSVYSAVLFSRLCQVNVTLPEHTV